MCGGAPSGDFLDGKGFGGGGAKKERTREGVGFPLQLGSIRRAGQEAALLGTYSGRYLDDPRLSASKVFGPWAEAANPARWTQVDGTICAHSQGI